MSITKTSERHNTAHLQIQNIEIDHIPTELLTKIFHYLEYAALLQLSRVNKRWYSITLAIISAHPVLNVLKKYSNCENAMLKGSPKKINILSQALLQMNDEKKINNLIDNRFSTIGYLLIEGICKSFIQQPRSEYSEIIIKICTHITKYLSFLQELVPYVLQCRYIPSHRKVQDIGKDLQRVSKFWATQAIDGNRLAISIQKERAKLVALIINVGRTIDSLLQDDTDVTIIAQAPLCLQPQLLFGLITPKLETNMPAVFSSVKYMQFFSKLPPTQILEFASYLHKFRS